MRKIAAAILAVPVFVALYLPVMRRRSVAIRAGLAAGAGLLVLAAAVGTLPRAASALPPATAGPVAAERFGPNVESRQALDGAVTFEFAAPMDEASVAAALTIDPQTPLNLAWLDGGRRLLVTSRSAWAPETYYTLTIASSARNAAGETLSDPLRTAFYTRGPTGGRIVATGSLANGRVSPDTAFIVAFDRPVDTAAARAAFRIDPPVAGELQSDNAVGPTEGLTFIPADGLAAGTKYTIAMAVGLVDTDGAPLAAISALAVETIVTPAVVRFRPRAGTDEIARDADISVRFTRSMERAATQRAFVVSVGGKQLAGDYHWAEDDTVVIFNPRDPLPWDTDVTMSITRDAVGADGIAISGPIAARFTTAAKPEATPTPTPAPTAKPTPAPARPTAKPTSAPAKPAPKPTPKPASPPSTGGGSTGGGAWAAAERYFLSLMNCTRGGGLVTSSGACSSPGGSGVAPLVLDSGISNTVSRPYAKLLATSGVCSHFDGGTPGDRLRRAGYTSYRWGENLGCLSASSANASALGTQLYFQSERSWSPPGGHYVNLMNPAYDRVGIGVWISGGQIRIVIDFYHP